MSKILEFKKLFAEDNWVKPFFKSYRKLFFLALFLGFFTFFSAAALMFNSGYLISRAASLPENILLIYIPIVLTRAFGIGRPVLRYIERLVSHNWVLKMTSDLRVKLYQSLEKEAIFFRSKYQTGDIFGLLSEDINHLQNLYLRTIFPTVVAWLLYSFIIIGLGFFSWWFGLCMLLMLGVVTFLFPLLSVIQNGAKQEQKKIEKGELYKNLTDNILGVSDWVFSQRGQEFVQTYEQKEKQLHQLDEQIKAANHFRDFLLQASFGVITVAVLAFTSIRFAGNHGGAANWIAAFTLTVFPLIDAFAPLSDAAQETTVYKDSIKRLNALPQPTEESEQIPIPEVQTPELSISTLTFFYPTSKQPVLENLNLTIAPKEKLAILGRSGSGKSTLAMLIRGDLKPSKGDIRLGGIATYEFGDAITRYIGVIHQRPYLFRTTILNNIRLGRESATEEEVWDVLDKVGLKEMVARLPEQLATMVDEAGLRFSGGERHRLALARILLQNTPIVLLDEPMTGLDPITEQQVLETFFDVLKDKTVLWITHHLQGIHLMDRVIFIEDGHLEMSGSPSELLNENTHYQQLYKIDRGE